MNSRSLSRRLKLVLRLTGVVVILALLFLTGIWLTPAPTLVYALQAPTQDAALEPAASTGVKGTIAAYAALFPQLVSLNLPVIIK